jgi:hypothetical protein
MWQQPKPVSFIRTYIIHVLWISDWNIIQIVSLFHAQNRFGSEISAPRKTPALFLSALTAIQVWDSRGRDSHICMVI